MSDFDFSLSNPKINAFFQGDDSNPPISEFLYLHNHPLISGNFIYQIMEEGSKLLAKIVEKNIQGSIINTISEIGVILGTNIDKLTSSSQEANDSALRILQALRHLHNLYRDVNANFNV